MDNNDPIRLAVSGSVSVRKQQLNIRNIHNIPLFQHSPTSFRHESQHIAAGSVCQVVLVQLGGSAYETLSGWFHKDTADHHRGPVSPIIGRDTWGTINILSGAHPNTTRSNTSEAHTYCFVRTYRAEQVEQVLWHGQPCSSAPTACERRPAGRPVQ
jgi:hypothetical protein